LCREAASAAIILSGAMQLRPRAITVDRGSRGFGLSLIYRGLDKFEEKDTGIFVARVVPGGQAARYGVQEGDKILTINGKTPRNVDDAVGVIKQAGNQIKLVVLREEAAAIPNISVNDGSEVGSIASDRNWDGIGGGQPISRSGSARSFNTTFGRPAPPRSRTPSPGPNRRGQPQQPQPQPQNNSPMPNQQQWLRQQEEYRRQQQQMLEDQRQRELAEQQRQEQLALEQQRQQELLAVEQQRQADERYQEQIRAEQEKTRTREDQVRNMIARTDFGSFDAMRPKSPGAKSLGSGGMSKMTQETKKSSENITRIIETVGPDGKNYNKYKSSNSLHELGLDNYPNPDMPEGTRLSRKEEKMSLQNLNNRLAGYIDRVRQLQQENAKLTQTVKIFEEHQTVEINNVKEIYEKQVDELKDALDKMNQQYNQLKVGAEGLLNENGELKEKIGKRDNDLKNAHDHVTALEDELRGLGNRMSEMESDKRKLHDQLHEVLPELDSLRDALNKAKRALDDDALDKADLQNKCERLEDDLKFKMELLEQELTEVKTRKEVEITEMDGKLQEEYECRLKQALDELRGVYDKQMEQSREDFSKLYDDRIRDLTCQLSAERGGNATTGQELKESRARIESLMRKVVDLESANLALNQKISDMAQEMDDARSAFRAQNAAKDEEIKRLLDELSGQLRAYQDLQDIKIALDMEIAVFRRLIECE
jgi:DNA repair exonuclease SbcCD ATPase subunit